MILAGTGHRPPRLGLSYSSADRDRLLRFVLPFLAEEYPSAVISGGAQGFDQALAYAALHLDIPLIVACPFEGQENKWPQDEQERYRELLMGATEVICLARKYSNKAFADRDRWMVERADRVLALMDGNPEKSGTRITVEHAVSLGKPVRNLWTAWQAAGREAIAEPG